jgi:hypothetical protein
MCSRSSFVNPLPAPVRTTLLALVQTLFDEGRSEPEIERGALELLEHGRVVLIGNFHGVPLCDSRSIDSNDALGSNVDPARGEEL